MFKILDEAPDTIEWPVKVGVPMDGGKVRKYEFIGIFRRRNQDEKDAAIRDSQNDDPSEWLENYVRRVSDILVGWRDVVDGAGAPIPYSADALRKALRSVSGNAFMVGLNDAIAEYETGSKAKN